MDIIAEHDKSKNFSQVWKSTNKLKPKASLPASVEGLIALRDVANLFRNNFRTRQKAKLCLMLRSAVPMLLQLK